MARVRKFTGKIRQPEKPRAGSGGSFTTGRAGSTQRGGSGGRARGPTQQSPVPTPSWIENFTNSNLGRYMQRSIGPKKGDDFGRR